MPTEYTLHGRVSEKTDAFSYGILLIELLTNLHPTKARTLLDEVGFPPLPRTRLPFLLRRCCFTSLRDLACVCSDRVRRTEIVEGPVWHWSAE